MIPKVTNLTEKQIKKAAINLIVKLFGEEYSHPNKVFVSEFNILIIYDKPVGDTMEPYCMDNGGEFAFNRNAKGKLAEVDIYTLDVLENYL